MTNEEAKLLKPGDSIQFYFNKRRQIGTGVVVEARTRTLFGTVIVTAASTETKFYRNAYGEIVKYVNENTVTTLKPKDIIKVNCLSCLTTTTTCGEWHCQSWYNANQ